MVLRSLWIMFKESEDRKSSSLTDGWEGKGKAPVEPVKSGYQTLLEHQSPGLPSIFSKECRGQDAVRRRGKWDTVGGAVVERS